MSESSDLSFSSSSISHTSPTHSETTECCKSEETIQQEKNPEFIAQLISVVKDVNILYDHSHKQYRNTEKKLEAWNFVKNEVGYLGEAQELADYFKIIRDRYTKAKRKVASKKPTKFQFLQELTFLDPHIADRSSWYEKSTNGNRHKIIKTPKVSNSNFYLRLIQMVQQNPCFYNTCDPNYRKYFYKCQIWNKIAKDLEYDGDNHGIYKQWKKLRDRYVRENRKLRTTGRSKSTCKWEFFNYMEWMEPFIEDSKPLEDYEIPLKRGEAEAEEMTKSIYENGKKKAQIKFLKPANKVLQMPKLLPQIDPNYTEYSESNHPIIVYANPDESHTSTIIVTSTTSGESDSIIQQPEITYYIEGSDDEQYILDSDALHYELHEEDVEGDEQQQEYDVDEEIESDEIGFPEEVLLSCQEDSEGPSSSNVIYAVNKHTDLNTLPENIRFAIEAQGKDVFKDKSIIYVK